MTLKSILFLMVLLLISGSSFAEDLKADFYVSPDGNDLWSGTRAVANLRKTDGPFKTIAKARDAVRIKIPRMKKDIIVMLADGEYFIDKTIVFGIEDGGHNGYKVIYRNFPGQTPILTSGVKITDWKKLSEEIPDLPEKAKGKVWVADLPENLRGFLTLYDKGKLLPRAKTEGFNPDMNNLPGQYSQGYLLKFPAGKMKKYSNLDSAELVVRPSHPVLLNILPLESVDTANNIAKTKIPASFPMKTFTWTGIYGNASMSEGNGNAAVKEGIVWVENVFEALDQPGEWVLDSTNGKLYLWPLADKPGDNIAAPTLTEFIRVEGMIDYNGPDDVPVKNIVFSGLKFTGGDRLKGEIYAKSWGLLPEDWEKFDYPSAVLRFRGAQNCTVEKCHFDGIGGSAIRFDLYSQKNIVANNLIENIGEAGISFIGYGPGMKNVNKQNRIFNNHIHHTGQIIWHSPAILAWQSGENTISNNLIHHMPYMGIIVTGRIVWDRAGRAESSRTIRWHEVDKVLPDKLTAYSWAQREPLLHGRKNIIEKNNIHHVVQKLGDGNHIYVSGTGAGNVVRQNYLHDSESIGMGSPVRCDEDQDTTIIEDNIMFRNGGSGIGIVIKGNNTITNNIIAEEKPVSPRWHNGYIAFHSDPVAGAVIGRNIFYATQAGLSIYWQQSPKTGARLKDTKTDYNLYYNTADPNWGSSHIQRERQFGIETHSISADPLFVDLENENFKLKPKSPALKMGFKQIDFKSIGLTRDFPKHFLAAEN